MDIYLLKFTACLFVLWLIYYVLLERQKNHKFKRFYLLGSIALSVIIPLLTITQYVEPAANTNEIITTMIPFESIPMEVPVETQEPFNWPLLLWVLYGLGAALFGFRFIGNLIKLYTTINRNEKRSIGSFIYVLLDHYRTPHSFFRYIFLNKDKYNTNNIPKEVIIHEETHAKQWHSADILLMELVQILLWFHPMVYILKHHIKLNHEFLADKAVLNNGVNTKTYQRILLEFSSSTSNQNLASTINYSSIKKRFTVMKTPTSKTKIWLSSLLILPIVALLFYSFAEKEYVEKEKSKKVPYESVIFEQDSRLQNYDSITTKYSEAIQQFLKGSRSDNSALKTLKTQADALYNSFKKEELSKHNILPPPPVPAQKQQNLPTQKEIEQYNAWAKKCNKQMAKANKDKSNEYPIVKLKDYKRFKAIYDSMSAEQRENAESFPEKFATLPPIPPKPPKPHLELKPKRNGENVSPPPAPPIPKNANPAEKKKMQKVIDDYEKIYKRKVHTAQNITSGETYSLIVNDEVDELKLTQDQNLKIEPIEIFIDSENNIQFNGKKVKANDINNEVKKLNQHLSIEEHRKYVSASIITEKTEALDYAKSIQIKLREVNVWSCSISSNEGLKKAGLASKHFSLYSGLTVKEAEEKQKKIFSESQYVDKKIDSINNSGGPWKVSTVVASYEFIDDDGNSSGKVNIEPTVLNKQKELPVIYINEKEPVKGQITLTKEELKKLKLSLSEGNVTNFKLKIPGIKTDFIKGNTISVTSIKNLENFDDGIITIFDIKDEKENRLPPIIIQLKK